MVQFTGHFDGKVIKPDERVEIPINTPLRVTIEPTVKQETPEVEWNRLLELAEDCAIEGPEDLALLHNHYAHGKPIE
ncbi:MAG TPA: hypothetical protein VHX86_03765 [Tepidisphaeraceae bacterium]|jgi:hypothetical protein|nr:hypothetical protein [Tepidisphaeraceae bacterium]